MAWSSKWRRAVSSRASTVSSRSSSEAVSSTGVGRRSVQVLGHHRQRTLCQVAQLVGQIGVDPGNDGFIAVAAVLAERHLAEQEVAHRIHAERFDEGDGSTTLPTALLIFSPRLNTNPCAKTRRGKSIPADIRKAGQ